MSCKGARDYSRGGRLSQSAKRIYGHAGSKPVVEFELLLELSGLLEGAFQYVPV